MGNIDWYVLNVIIAGVAMLMGGAALFDRLMGRALTIREHMEFKEYIELRLAEITEAQKSFMVRSEFSDWRDQFHRDFDRLEDMLKEIRTDIRSFTASTESVRN